MVPLVAAPPAEPRQRWRLTFARDPMAADLVGRATLDAWQETLVGCGLPVAGLERGGAGRGRIAFAAPLPAAARGEAELADVWLLERCPAWAVREALAERLPAGHRWVRSEDVWLGAPSLAGRVVAADWRIEVTGTDVAKSRLEDAARRLLGVRSLPRVRLKGSTEKRYDLRPLLADIAIGGPATGAADSAPDAMTIVRIRTRFDPGLGAGRPDEVVAALGEVAGADLLIRGIVRERLLLVDEVASPMNR